MTRPVARFGAIGDIHCEDRHLEAALRWLADRAVDRVLAVGDIVDGEGDVDRCIELLEANDVVTVRGNHDRWFLGGEMRDVPGWTREVRPGTHAFLASLPPTVEMRTVGGKLMLCHGIGDDDMAVLTPDARGYAIQAALSDVRHRDDVRFFVGGHTHQRMVRRIGPFTFFNPGTLQRGLAPGFLLVDLVEGWAEHHDLADDGSIALATRVALPGEE